MEHANGAQRVATIQVDTESSELPHSWVSTALLLGHDASHPVNPSTDVNRGFRPAAVAAQV